MKCDVIDFALGGFPVHFLLGCKGYLEIERVLHNSKFTRFLGVKDYSQVYSHQAPCVQVSKHVITGLPVHMWQDESDRGNTLQKLSSQNRLCRVLLPLSRCSCASCAQLCATFGVPQCCHGKTRGHHALRVYQHTLFKFCTA